MAFKNIWRDFCQSNVGTCKQMGKCGLCFESSENCSFAVLEIHDLSLPKIHDNCDYCKFRFKCLTE
jgi:hypothetical protein